MYCDEVGWVGATLDASNHNRHEASDIWKHSKITMYEHRLEIACSDSDIVKPEIRFRGFNRNENLRNGI